MALYGRTTERIDYKTNKVDRQKRSMIAGFGRNLGLKVEYSKDSKCRICKDECIQNTAKNTAKMMLTGKSRKRDGGSDVLKTWNMSLKKENKKRDGGRCTEDLEHVLNGQCNRTTKTLEEESRTMLEEKVAKIFE